jgi:hypothetical protein
MQIDAGFDARVLAEMIATLDRFSDSEVAIAMHVQDGRFYAVWSRAEVRRPSPGWPR